MAATRSKPANLPVAPPSSWSPDAPASTGADAGLLTVARALARQAAREWWAAGDEATPSTKVISA